MNDDLLLDPFFGGAPPASQGAAALAISNPPLDLFNLGPSAASAASENVGAAAGVSTNPVVALPVSVASTASLQSQPVDVGGGGPSNLSLATAPLADLERALASQGAHMP